MTSVAAPDQETHSIETAGLREIASSRHRLVAGLASGLLLWTSFPPVEWSWLAWVALVPLFWLATLREAAFEDLPGGLGRGPGLLAARPRMAPAARPRRLARLDPDGPGLFPLVAGLPGPDPLGRLPLADPAHAGRAHHLGGPASIGRAYFLTGFPWYYLAHSQFRHLYLIQIADFAGSLGISLLIAVVNALIVDLLTLPLLQSIEARNAAEPAPERPALPRHDPPGYDLLLRSVPGLERRVSRRAQAGALQSNIEQKHKIKGDPLKILAEFARADRARARAPRAARPDRLAGDRLSVRLHRRSTPTSIAATLEHRSARSRPRLSVAGLAREAER